MLEGGTMGAARRFLLDRPARGRQGGKLVSEYLGEHRLMFSSDYGHAETRFPSSVGLPPGRQEVSPDLMRTIL
jgi:hypothetical protein